ncbi:MAG: hypothetical protein KH138_06210 [Firmicutes bacterium]|nr:hypothetical protein [Bacillota bacterium]
MAAWINNKRFIDCKEKEREIVKNRYALLMAGILSVALLTGCTSPGTPVAAPQQRIPAQQK